MPRLNLRKMFARAPRVHHARKPLRFHRPVAKRMPRLNLRKMFARAPRPAVRRVAYRPITRHVHRPRLNLRKLFHRRPVNVRRVVHRPIVRHVPRLNLRKMFHRRPVIHRPVVRRHVLPKPRLHAISHRSFRPMKSIHHTGLRLRRGH